MLPTAEWKEGSPQAVQGQAASGGFMVSELDGLGNLQECPVPRARPLSVLLGREDLGSKSTPDICLD